MFLIGEHYTSRTTISLRMHDCVVSLQNFLFRTVSVMHSPRNNVFSVYKSSFCCTVNQLRTSFPFDAFIDRFCSCEIVGLHLQCIQIDVAAPYQPALEDALCSFVSRFVTCSHYQAQLFFMSFKEVLNCTRQFLVSSKLLF
jgi:hypothetical protein